MATSDLRIRARSRASALLLAALAAALAGPGRASERARVVAVGDVHGAYESLTEILRTTGLIDAEERWIGGDSILVQTGDVVDRGPAVREVLDLLMSLETEAPATGGRVVGLLGNHELMNLVGDLRDVAPETLATFVDVQSTTRRERAWEGWREWALERGRARGLTDPQLPPDTRERWMEEHPLGLLEYREALAPGALYGGWLRRRPVAVRVAGTLFMHAGLSPAFSTLSIDELDALHAEILAEHDSVRAELVEEGVILPFFDLVEMNAVVRQEEAAPRAGPGAAGRREAVARAVALLDRLQRVLESDSPLWYRGYSKLAEAELAELAGTLRRTHLVEHFVSAHSPLRSATITPRLDGVFFLIDTGMLVNVYDGRPSALEIADGRFSAVYPGSRQVLLEAREDGATAGSPSRRSHRPGGTLAPVPAAWLQGPGAPASDALPARRWYDVEGRALPFQEDEEILAFLRTAPVVEQGLIGSGVTKPKKLTLERDGIRVHASFRYVHEEQRNVRLADGSNEMFFLDSYRNEVPAYELGRMLGMDAIPPTVLRQVDGQQGSVQIWVEDSVTQKKRAEEGTPVPGPVVVRFNRQTHDMDVFDNLVRNIDRNAGNIVWDKDWNLWLIDCTRCFAQGKDLPKPADLVKVSRPLWAALRALDETALGERLGAYLTPFQIKALLARRDKVVTALEKRIRELGEDEVLFDYDDPAGGVTVTYDES